VSPLHIDYRPKSLDEFFGNESLKASLRTMFERQDKPKAFMFTGPSGCGKTTLARIVAQEYGCNMETDYHELNIAQIGGKDESGRIQREMHYAPMGSKVKVYCLDECQDASPAFQSGILKALEDTPRHVLFIICTTDPQKLKKTIHTRCSRFEVELFTPQLMFSFIQETMNKEGLENYPPEPIAEIVKAAEGCPRQALVILDQVIDLPDFESVMSAVRSYTIEEASVIELCRSLLANNWMNCAKQLNALPEKADVEKIRYAVLSYMRKVLLGNRPDGQAARVIQAFRLPFYDSGLAGLVLASYVAVTRMNLDMPY
jgi:DNA polymerase-3 subunit gamma/tau